MPENEVMNDLAALFDPREIKWKPQTVSGNRAMAIAYIDARVVMERLDDVMGIANWQDLYDPLPDGSVVCRLSLRINNEWITKTDVGGQSEQPDEGDRHKAAFSDALKRTAVKFGIGRYLYRLPHQWVDYDVQKRRFAADPKLPAWAVPSGKSNGPPPAKKESPKATPGAVPLPNPVDAWLKWLAADPSIDDLNQKFHELKQFDAEARKVLWAATKKFAEDAGLRYESATNMFVRQEQEVTA